MIGRFAVIGWGSLIWDLDTLAPHVELPWLMRAGPALSMEFTRVSPKRKMGLAVCLDPVDGVPCPTHVVPSARGDIHAVRADLAARERTDHTNIGALCLGTGVDDGNPAIVVTVRAWCLEHGWQGAVWTDITPNYAQHHGRAFDVAHAMAYLQGLRGESRDEAVRYIENAPLTTDTPLRRALSLEDWWQAEAVRVRHLDGRD